MADDDRLLQRIDREAETFTGSDRDLDALVEQTRDARIVLLGEATHGTDEFYAVRAELTRRLIEEHGFEIVAVEADWPDAYRLNRYVRATSADESAREALEAFERFPLWMWRNTEVESFVDWLRDYNESLEPEERVGFYGLDLYSLHRSIEAVVDYLEEVDPAAADRARERYACFDHVDADPRAYGMNVVRGVESGCREAVVEQLVELRRDAARYLERDGFAARDEQFFAEQNARVAKNAETYYRAMFEADLESWNVRDRHMFGTLENLLEHRAAISPEAKIVVWEHNSHLGDARATSMARRGEINVGQLVRETYGDDAVLVGFTTYDGSVSAASNWGEPVDHKIVREARDDSYEGLFHRLDEPFFSLDLRDGDARSGLLESRWERAIGVIYRPETEMMSHYFRAQLPHQFDAVVHLDRTRALEPLDVTTRWEEGEDLPETFPTGL